MNTVKNKGIAENMNESRSKGIEKNMNKVRNELERDK